MVVRSELLVYWDRRFAEYTNPNRTPQSLPPELFAVDIPHWDRPERAMVIKHILERTLDERTAFESVTPARREQLALVHDEAYVERVESHSESGEKLAPNTPTTSDTFEVARYAAGAAIQTAESAMEGGLRRVPYALARPSGHHAQSDMADGFCYFNNAAIATQHLVETGRADRVAIVDWDVHHGNGTQEIFYDRDDVLFVSIHNDHGAWHPVHHPQEGSRDEIGTGDGRGYTVNAPVPSGTGDEGYAYAFEHLVEPIVAQFDPDVILLSAGQDGDARDPLGRNVLTPAGFRELGARVRELARRETDGRLGVIQEGGYQIEQLALDTLGVLEGILDAESAFDDEIFGGDDRYTGFPAEDYERSVEWVRRAGRAYDSYWDLEFP